MSDILNHQQQSDTGAAARPSSTPPPAPAPPRGPRLRVLAFMALLLAGGIGLGVAMHESLARGFDSMRAAISATNAASPAAAASTQYYTCGMHPWVVQPEPGLCPICHMELTPMDPDKLTGELTIDPIVVQNIGVRTASVEQGPLRKTIRTVGTVTYDQTAVRDVNTKVGGWIETLHVAREGEHVEQGEPLLEVYSPELYAAQQEYLIAFRNQNTTDTSDELLDSARTRLRYFDMTDAQIAALEQRGTPQKSITLHSPHTGVVTAMHASEGMRIEPDMRLYQVADLSTVWVMVSIYESQLPYVERGQTAQMHLTYLPNRTFEGEVAEVYPYMNTDTRQAKARLRFDNTNGTLKPGMYATIELQSTLAQEAVLVPTEAVIGTGERQLVLVSLGEGRFEPRDVTTGTQSSAGRVQILEGLKPGERIVTSGQFLLDSESRTREALAKMVKSNMAAAPQPEVASTDEATLQPLAESARMQLAAVLDHYMAIGDTLYRDDTTGVAEQARQLDEAFNALTATPPPDAPHFWHQHHDTTQTIRTQAQAMQAAQTLDGIRIAYGKLSPALETLLKATGVPAGDGQAIDRLVCGMVANAPQGGLWLQPANIEPRNPYMGAAMPRCQQSDKRQRLPSMKQAHAQTPATQPIAQPQTPASSPADHAH